MEISSKPLICLGFLLISDWDVMRQIRTYVFNYYQLRSVNVRLLHNLQSCYRNNQQHTYCEIYAGNYL